LISKVAVEILALYILKILVQHVIQRILLKIRINFSYLRLELCQLLFWGFDDFDAGRGGKNLWGFVEGGFLWAVEGVLG
jgi:hypothetical protein